MAESPWLNLQLLIEFFNVPNITMEPGTWSPKHCIFYRIETYFLKITAFFFKTCYSWTVKNAFSLPGFCLWTWFAFNTFLLYLKQNFIVLYFSLIWDSTNGSEISDKFRHMKNKGICYWWKIFKTKLKVAKSWTKTNTESILFLAASCYCLSKTTPTQR